MQNKYNRLVPFLEDLYREVTTSEKSFDEFFELIEENIEAFKDTDLFKKYLKQYPQHDEIINTLFSQMSKDFGDGKVYIYLPNEDGDYDQEQITIFYKLVDFLTLKSGAETTPPSAKTTMEKTTKLMKEAGNLEVIEPLKLNKKGTMIVGKVRNPNDPTGKALRVFIDPNMPEEIGFIDANGKMFKVEASQGGLGIFIGASSEDILEFTGQSKTDVSAEVTLSDTTLPTTTIATAGIPTEPAARTQENEDDDRGEDPIQNSTGMPTGMSSTSKGKTKQGEIKQDKPKQDEEQQTTDPQQEYQTQQQQRVISPKRIVSGNQPIFKQGTEQGMNLRMPNYVSNMEGSNKGRKTEKQMKEEGPREQTEAPQQKPRPKKSTDTGHQSDQAQKKKGNGGKILAAAAGFAGVSIPGILVITDIV
ncbi:hypothetical protein HOG17_00750 [Candidatus Peregrinibacteria bacterium]|nr:hypothetical protein [Candidatus Peregrinibacteria bacterium]MBT4148619.1 hypothetical protein [Candidatus Peregrinibacteria bacterium]MBT4366246.1 hypothetical protein [Candidatus Peregrinibacteria bacterium]MBT4455764.1 hypothetical protein [Candidatus Peregrinibacteria bacterium]